MTSSKIFSIPENWDRVNNTNHTFEEIHDLLNQRWDEVSPSERREARAIGFHPKRRDPIVKVSLFETGKLGAWEVAIFQRSVEGVVYDVYGGRITAFSPEVLEVE